MEHKGKNSAVRAQRSTPTMYRLTAEHQTPAPTNKSSRPRLTSAKCGGVNKMNQSIVHFISKALPPYSFLGNDGFTSVLTLQ